MLTREERLIAQRHVQNIYFGRGKHIHVAWGVATMVGRVRRRRY